MDNTPIGIDEKNIRKWQLMGYEPLFERGTVRIPDFRKEFSADTIVTVYSKEMGGYAPLILPASGKVLKARDVLPERADLALDEEGHVLPRGEFESNYKFWLDAWVYDEDDDPNAEHIPDVIDFISHEPDRYSESRGPIEINWDPKLNQEFKPEQKFDSDGRSEAEIEAEKKASGSDSNSELMSMLLGELSEEKKLELAEKLVEKHQIPVVSGSDEGKPLAVEVAPPPNSAVKEMEVAPCGKEHTKGYGAQHKRHCKDEACGGDES